MLNNVNVKNVNKVSKEQWYNKLKIVDPNCFLTLKSPLKDHLRSQPMVPPSNCHDTLQLWSRALFSSDAPFLHNSAFCADRQTDRQGHSNSPPFALQAGKGWTKIEAILQMRIPEDKKALLQALGMATYLVRIVPRLQFGHRRRRRLHRCAADAGLMGALWFLLHCPPMARRRRSPIFFLNSPINTKKLNVKNDIVLKRQRCMSAKL
jgi:hypothetical protein